MSTAGQVTTFNYTGALQIHTIAITGIYKLETYGATGGLGGEYWDGGGGHYYGLPGSVGDYVKGEIALKVGDILYIYSGGKGINGTMYASSTGGASWYYGMSGGGGGGGATEIMLNANSTANKIIIARGGNGGNGQGSTGGTNRTPPGAGGYSSSEGYGNMGYQQNGGAGGGYDSTTTLINPTIQLGIALNSGQVIITLLRLTNPDFTGNISLSTISNQDVQLSGILSNSINVQVQYILLINGKQIYPASTYTTLTNTPFDINYTIPNNLFNVGSSTVKIQIANESGLLNDYNFIVTKPIFSGYLIKDSSNAIYTFNGTSITLSSSQILDDNNFINNGFVNPLLITSDIWNYFVNKNGLRLLYWTNDTKTNDTILYNSTTYRPLDKVTDKLQILMYEN